MSSEGDIVLILDIKELLIDVRGNWWRQMFGIVLPKLTRTERMLYRWAAWAVGNGRIRQPRLAAV